MQWETFDSQEALSDRAAHLMLDAIRENPRIVLGLPTGRTPVGMYDRVVRECAREYFCFRDVVTFNLDEYAGVAPEHPGSYFTYMKRHLFDHVDVDPANAHIPHGTAPDLAAECVRYENEIAAAGGLELTFLGLGRNGHVAFNEPGTPFDSRTRVVELTPSTRAANEDTWRRLSAGADRLIDGPGSVPTHAITMGIGTILESRRIVLLAAGRGKEEALARLQGGALDVSFPASALWMHEDVTALCVNASSESP